MHTSLVCVVKFSDQYTRFTDFLEANQSSQVQLGFTKLHLMATTLEACIFFMQCLFSIKFVGLCFP